MKLLSQLPTDINRFGKASPLILLICKKIFLLAHRSGSFIWFRPSLPSPLGRFSFGIRPIRLSMPNCGCRASPIYVIIF